jgi:hypothetical protein
MPFSGDRTTCEPSFAHPTMQSPQKSLAPDEPKYLLAREGIILVAGLVAVPGVGHAPTLVEPEVLPALDRFLGNLQGERNQ